MFSGRSINSTTEITENTQKHTEREHEIPQETKYIKASKSFEDRKPKEKAAKVTA